MTNPQSSNSPTPLLTAEKLYDYKIQLTLKAGEQALLILPTYHATQKLLHETFINTNTQLQLHASPEITLIAPPSRKQRTAMRQWRQQNLTIWSRDLQLPPTTPSAQAITHFKKTTKNSRTDSEIHEICRTLNLKIDSTKPLNTQTEIELAKLSFACALGKKASLLVAITPTDHLNNQAAKNLTETAMQILRDQQIAGIWTTTNPHHTGKFDHIFILEKNTFRDATNLTPEKRAALLHSATTENTTEKTDTTQPEPTWHPRPTAPKPPESNSEKLSPTTYALTETLKTTHHPLATEQIDLTVLDNYLTKTHNIPETTNEITTTEPIQPLPGETLEETLQRLAPARKYDAATEHLLDEAKRILNALPGSVAPQFPTTPKPTQTHNTPETGGKQQ